jgi:murein DD-endopeptidase MepM/ murein hydrolase activator NlpD
VRRVLRFCAVVVLLLGSSVVLPPPWTGPVAIPEAAAQLPPIPLPTPPDLPGLPDPFPDPEPDPDPTPPPNDDPEEEPDDDGKAPTGGSSQGGESRGEPSGDVAGDPSQTAPTGEAPIFEVPKFEYARIPGAYSTDGLMMAAARLRSLGWSRESVLAEAFPPFIIAGRANWVDSWGAARYGPGPIIRRHEGQDVFCEYGDPVLAVNRGVVDYGAGGLGGIVARLHRPGGGYWYYAHLSDTNDDEFPAGTTVGRGDVLGYCGNSGNAITTPPHVHFGWYRADGVAANPMRALVSWLRRAERNAAVAVARASGERLIRLTSLISARRFGDELIPGLKQTSALGESASPETNPPENFARSSKESAD